MTTRIEAKEAPLGKIFSDDFAFTIPIYQRPFSWSTTNFEALFDDIKQAIVDGVDQYFLGSILLQHNDGNSFDVVDGQQRLTALTILLAVIRDNSNSSDLRNAISSWIYQAGDKWKGLPSVMRVTPWEELKDFFDRYLYQAGGTIKFLREMFEGKIKYKDQEDPKFHFFEAVSTFAKRLGGETDLDRYIQYLLKSVYCVYIITSTQTSAFRLFNVLNSRGMPLDASDLLKSESLGMISEATMREKYAYKWRNLEEGLGREELSNVIAFVRTIQLKEKARLGMYEEYKQIFDKNLLKRGMAFIDYLVAISSIYRSRVLEADLETGNAEEKNNYRVTVDLMFRFIPFLDWIPPLLAFQHKYESEKDLLKFLLVLERKIVLEWVSGFSPTERVVSSGSVLKAIEKSKEPGEAIMSVEMPEKARAEKALLDRLNDREFYWIYGKRLAKYLLLRIDKEYWELENFPGYPGTITVEHVLPQNPSDDSPWLSVFSGQNRENLTDTLGNLVLLSGRMNSEAQNYDFARKKQVYFGKKGTPFRITQQLAKYDEWRPDSVNARHKELVGRCRRVFLTY